MTCEDIRYDLEAYALGALQPAEAALVAQHLEQCEECSALARSYELTVESLALGAPLYRASPRLRERVLGGAGKFPTPTLGSLRRQWWAASAAAILIAFAMGSVAWAVVLSNEVSRLKADNVRLAELTELDAEQRSALFQLRDELNSARNEQRRMSTTLNEQATLLVVALDPDRIQTEMAGTSLAPAARCSYVWSNKQAVGALTCHGLPTTGFALAYELWATKGDNVLPLGSFLPADDGTASMLVKFPKASEGDVTNLWVTLEESSLLRQRPSEEIVLRPEPAQQASR